MDNKTKKIVTKEWLRAFPSLRPYAQNKLYKVIGAFICGIELIKLPHIDSYRPHFVIYPIYKKDNKSCLDYPVLMFEFYNSKKLQLNLPYDNVNEKLEDALNIVSNSLQISFEGNVPLGSFYKLIDDIQKTEVTSHSGKIASLLELKFFATLHVGSQSQVQSILNQIKQSSKGWNMDMFETWYGKFDLWFSNLEATICNREEFLKQIETNKQDKKIAKLQSSELIL